MLAGWTAAAATLYAQNEGIPNLSVQSLALDDQGFLWAGTEDGALRFDGHRFLRIDMDLPNELPDWHARRLLAVPGAVYIATPSRLLRYDLNQHVMYSMLDADADMLNVYAMTRTHEGFIYAGSSDGLLWRWRDDGVGVPKPESLLASGAASIPGINGIYAGPNGIWLATNGGVYRFDPGSSSATAFAIAEPELRNGTVTAITTIEFPAGVLWIGYWNDALLRLDLETRQQRWFHPAKAAAGALRSTSIFSFAAREDRLYVGTNRGIVVYHPSCDCIRGLNHPGWDQVDGVGIVATALLTEHDGLWAGIWGSGLVRFGPTDEVFQHQVKRDNRANSLAHPMVYALHVSAEPLADQRRLWIGTYGGGVQWSTIGQQREGEDWALESLPWGAYPIESKFVWSLVSGAADELMIGTGRGLFRWQHGTLNEVGAKAAIESIRSYLVTSDGRRYVGTMRGLYREQGGALSPVVLSGATNRRDLPQGVWSLSQQGDELWLGTVNGLLRLAGDERLIAWHEAGLRDDQLPGPVVRVQKRDAEGSLWLGTSGGLVKVVVGVAGPHFERHAALAQVGVKSITSIEFDGSGQLWLGSPNGLVRFRPQSREVDLFDHKDGLVSDQLNSNASANDGRLLYFGGMGGLISFDPTAIPERTVILAPRISRLRLGKGPWQLDARALSLDHQHEPIQVELTALSYARPTRVRYAYRWRETEREFTELGDAQSVVVSRLPSGLNTLEVRASVPAPGAQEVVGQVLTVKIAAVWYESAWGRASFIGLLAALLYAWTRWRTLQARGYARQLEGDVADRTAQLTATSAALVEANTRLRTQATLDPLTALANRRQLFEIAGEKVLEGVTLSVMICDLDHFKEINDRYGHQVGDAVLSDFAELLRQVVGEHGLAARYGGEEFVALLFDASLPEFESAASRLIDRARARRVSFSGNSEIRYATSAGLAQGCAGEALDTLIRRADQALYQAKNAGRDCWKLATGESTRILESGQVQQTRER